MIWNTAILLVLAQATASTSADEAARQAVEAAESAAATARSEIDCGEQATQMVMNVCSYRDYEAADLALNQTWDQVSAKAKRADDWSKDHNFPGGEFNRLLDSQRKWLAFRDAQCLYENGPREQSGTIWPLLQNSCLKKLTERRISELRETLEPNA
ncbi:DUF1311 domain-containing protein [Altererythrobacter salegens]|uniref:DUF1311 domain-containing protein n=1 Tax=Croceibacterium salegens TaxID=1737568 RepID=A0A6I4SWH2_9SPHN|nr:lysozyme inhibitor LprI family protein [Croceibacterium salegens]MXO60351.1 DUF1311 domain-containing protein [Croceibacterium salegens]